MNSDHRSLRVSQALDNYTPPRPDGEMVDRIMVAVKAANRAQEAEKEGSPIKKNRVRRVWWIAAATFTVAVLVGLVWFMKPNVVRGSLTATEKTVVDLGRRAQATVEAQTRIDYAVRQAFLFWETEAFVTQGKGTVRYRVQRGGPFVVTTPSARVRVTGTDFQVEVFEMKRKTKGALIGAGLSIATAVTVYAGSVILENDAGIVALAAGQSGRAESGAAPMRDGPAQQNEQVVENEKEQTPNKIHRLKNKEQRDRLIKAIHLARQRRLMKEKNGVEEPIMDVPEDIPDNAAIVLGPLPKETVSDAVEAVINDVRNCYEKPLQSNPKLEGALRVDFSIAIEQGTGGIVERVEINEKSDDVLEFNTDLTECIINTIYTLEFPYAEGNGTATVSYPLIFSTPKDPKDLTIDDYRELREEFATEQEFLNFLEEINTEENRETYEVFKAFWESEKNM